MKIGILTYHKSINYGAYVQALCLQREIVNQTGYDVEIIDYDTKSSNRYYKKQIIRKDPIKTVLYFRRYKMFCKMQKLLPLSSFSIVSDEIDSIKDYIINNYDLIVVGSDEVWKIGGLRPFPNLYWLPNIKKVRKITYAVSGRNNINELDNITCDSIKNYIDSFEYISVRDIVTKKMIDELLPKGRESFLVCDPTLAYNFSFDIEEGKRLLRKKFRVNPNKKIVAIMDNTGEIIANIKQSNQIQYISLFSIFMGVKTNPNISPEEWVQIIGAVDGLITTFYHGMCIALNSNTPFLFCEEREIKEDIYSKAYDLLSRYEMEDSYIHITDTRIKERIDDFVTSIESGQMKVDFSVLKRSEQSKFNDFIECIKNIQKDISEDNGKEL